MYRRSFIASGVTLPFIGHVVSDKFLPPEEIEDGHVLRIWKLGDPERGIYPTDAACQILADIINNWDHVSSLDIIWGPELTVEEHRLDGKPTTDMIQANHTLETIIESLVKEFPELDEHRNRIFNCLSIGLKNAEPSKNDNS
jgi:hypothetical protein